LGGKKKMGRKNVFTGKKTDDGRVDLKKKNGTQRRRRHFAKGLMFDTNPDGCYGKKG